MKLKIYLVDDEPMAIKYFKLLLQEAKIDCEVVGEAMNGAKALHEIPALQPDLVFADISMPVMDGLLMAEKILSENRQQKIILMTSYRDFDYAKRGMNIGVSDYILKNELSEDYLKKLFGKIEQDIMKDNRARYVMLEYNTRSFLLTSTNVIEDRIYKTKPFQRYILLSVIKRPQVSVSSRLQEEHTELDCYRLMNLCYPQGITCRVFTEISEGEWCGIFFIDSTVSDSMAKIKEAIAVVNQEIILKCEDCVFMISKSTGKFMKLPQLYGELKSKMEYIYACRELVLTEENMMLPIKDSAVLAEQLIEELASALDNENTEYAKQQLDAFFKNSLLCKNQWNYTEDLRSIYRFLKKYMLNKKIVLEDAMELEQCTRVEKHADLFKRHVEKIIEKQQEQRQNQYSFYCLSAIEYMKKNYDRNISVPEIADAVKISEGHLRKCFKQETNKKIVDYLLEYRLDRAKSLMKSGERRMDEVWQKTGFTSGQYFSYVFKKNEGMTPSDYLKQQSR